MQSRDLLWTSWSIFPQLFLIRHKWATDALISNLQSLVFFSVHILPQTEQQQAIHLSGQATRISSISLKQQQAIHLSGQATKTTSTSPVLFQHATQGFLVRNKLELSAVRVILKMFSRAHYRQ